MTLENCGFPEYMVSIEWEPMTLYVAVTQQVNMTIKSGWWFQPLWKNMKVTWGYYSQYMEIRKSHGPNHQPEMLLWSGGYPHFIEEIPKGISYINDVSVYLYTYDVCVNLTFKLFVSS